MFKSNINLNLYKTFYDVAKYGNFSKAAELTYSTQPAISKAIKKLESELEVNLFYRKSNGVELTDKGKELLFYVEKSFGNLLIAERVLLETDTLKRGKLSIGLPSNLIPFIMDSIIQFKKKYSNIEITIINGNTSYLLEQLDLHKIDFIIDMDPIININGNLTINKLYDAKYCFVSSNSFPCDIKSLKDLEKYQLILPIPDTTNRDNLTELFIKNDIGIDNIINIHTSEVIKMFVLNGLGIGYLLYDFVKDDINKGLLKEIKIKEELPTCDIVIAYNNKFLTKAPKIFINEFLNHMN